MRQFSFENRLKSENGKNNHSPGIFLYQCLRPIYHLNFSDDALRAEWIFLEQCSKKIPLGCLIKQKIKHGSTFFSKLVTHFCQASSCTSKWDCPTRFLANSSQPGQGQVILKLVCYGFIAERWYLVRKKKPPGFPRGYKIVTRI